MLNTANMLDKIISLADFSTMDHILFHHNFIVQIFLLGLLFFNLFCSLLLIFHNKILVTLLFINLVFTLFASLAVFSFGELSRIERRTTLNEQQITLLKTIDDPKLIQVINYNVAKYGKNLYAIDFSLSETDITLEEIARAVNPPKFLELKSN